MWGAPLGGWGREAMGGFRLREGDKGGRRQGQLKEAVPWVCVCPKDLGLSKGKNWILLLLKASPSLFHRKDNHPSGRMKSQHFFFFFFLAVPVAYGSSLVRD